MAGFVDARLLEEYLRLLVPKTRLLTTELHPDLVLSVGVEPTTSGF